MDGSQQLIPDSLQGNKKIAVYGFIGLLVCFGVVAALMGVVYGSKKGLASWWLLSLGLVGLLFTVCVMLNWLANSTLEDKMKYVVALQLALLCLAGVGLIMDVFTPEKTCPQCVPPSCYNQVMGLINSCQPVLGNTCPSGVGSFSECFSYLPAPYPRMNGTITVSFQLASQLEREAAAGISPVLTGAAVSIGAAAAASQSVSSPSVDLAAVQSPSSLSAEVEPMLAVETNAIQTATDEQIQEHLTHRAPTDSRSAHHQAKLEKKQKKLERRALKKLKKHSE